MYYFGCKDCSQSFRQQEVKMENKILREKSHCVARKSRFLKNKWTTNVIKTKWILIVWSVKKILKILTQKCLEQK